VSCPRSGLTLRCRRCDGRTRDQRGFALVLVIWAIGIISLLALSFIGSARYRIRAAANVVGGIQAEALAEAGVNIAKLALLAGHAAGGVIERSLSTDGQLIRCAMPNDSVAAIAIDDEGGKVDLNAASPGLLGLLLHGFGATPDQAEGLARAITDFGSTGTNAVLDDVERKDYAAAGRPYGPKKALLETTLELDQVIGMPHDLFRRVLPYVTVHSHQPGIDPQRASLVLLAALAGEKPEIMSIWSSGSADSARQSLVAGLPVGIASSSTGRSFLIHVEVSVPGQSTFVREAIVEFANGPKPLLLREWRRGELRPGFLPALSQLKRDGGATAMSAC
jgi:general secretion pathway protein K